MELEKTTHIVKSILEQYPHTRDDDYLLWLRAIEIAAARENMPTLPHSVTLAAYLTAAKCSRFPHFETVSRVRRKLQEQYPELRGTPRTRVARAKAEEEYRKYARKDV